MLLKLLMHRSSLNKCAQMMFASFFMHVYTKCLKELFKRPNTTSSIAFLLKRNIVAENSYGCGHQNSKDKARDTEKSGTFLPLDDPKCSGRLPAAYQLIRAIEPWLFFLFCLMKNHLVYFMRKIPHGCSMACNCHQFSYLPLISLSVLPKVRYFVTFFVPASICVEAYAALGSIMVVTICECSDANRRFFSLKNHWLIHVIRNVYDEMTPGKALMVGKRSG
jgi:hypothetical protein